MSWVHRRVTQSVETGDVIADERIHTVNSVQLHRRLPEVFLEAAPSRAIRTILFYTPCGEPPELLDVGELMPKYPQTRRLGDPETNALGENDFGGLTSGRNCSMDRGKTPSSPR